jgi:gamma-glutamyltranspeptidase/glutathione hydrolase
MIVNKIGDFMNTFTPFKFALGALSLAALAACSSTQAPSFNYTVPAQAAQAQPEGDSGWQDKTAVRTQKWMVAAANPIATDAGNQILKAGGSALDAAIAVQMVLSLVEPQSSGIGGGAFLMHFDGREVLAYDGRETAPKAATDQLFMRDGKPMAFYDGVVGGRSVGVPGAVRMLELAHAKHGKLPWASLFKPAIILAEQGFAVSARLHGALKTEPHLKKDPTAAAYFYDAAGNPHPVGHVLKNPELAAVLKAISLQGSKALLEGEVAAAIVAKVSNHLSNAGLLTLEDMAAYQAKVRQPICSDYRQVTVCGMPPPSSGGIAIAQMLGMLENRNVALSKPDSKGLSADAVHLFSEVGRLAYADRGQYVADTDFTPLPGVSNASGIAAMLNKNYLKQRGASITDKSNGSAKAGNPFGVPVAWAKDQSPELPSTSHISVVDAYGNAIAMTTTIEDVFGSRQMVKGFLLNNQLTDFSFASVENGQAVANKVEGGKRPRSSMSPTLVFDKASFATQPKLLMSTGSPGGSAIINYVAKVLVGTLDWQLNIQEAIALPNFGSRNGPTELELGRIPPTLEAELKARGHNTRVMEMTSGLQGIMRDGGVNGKGWIGGADPRREGVVLGE